MTKKSWGDIEQLPFRIDVGTAFAKAMSASYPAGVTCLTADGRIVLNGMVFGGASRIMAGDDEYLVDTETGCLEIPWATAEKGGFMSATDKALLDGLPSAIDGVRKDLEAETEDLRGRCSALEAENGQRINEIAALGEKDAQLEAAIDRLAAGLSEEIAERTRNVVNLSAETEDLRGQVSSLRSDMGFQDAQLEAKIEDCAKSVTNLADDYDRLAARVKKNEKDIADIAGILAEIPPTEALAGITERLKTIEDCINLANGE